MKNIFLLILLFFAIIIESSVLTIPLVLDIIIVLYIFERKSWIFALAFFAGLLLDIGLVRNVGQSSIFFVICLFILNLYERKFEIVSGYFALFFSFFGSIIFLFLSKENLILQDSILSAIFTVILFAIFKTFSAKKNK